MWKKFGATMDDFGLIKNYLEKNIDKQTFEKWIIPLEYIGTKNNVVFVCSSDSKKNAWIKTNLLSKFNKNIKKDLNLALKIVSPLIDDDDDKSDSTENISDPFSPASGKKKIIANLQPRYTFENFVQVEQNRLAYSFAHSVADFPGKSYNPLYIYSDVGLGKTHLLYAIGNRIVKNNKNLNVIYSTTSEFMHEYVDYNRLNKRSEFINKYTSVDVLLIDDIQYITKWEGTSEQFYYIFNKLIQSEKQIVLCSDKHPDKIPDLEQRIKSRFEWGSIVDILHYDLEGRLAILKNKLQERAHSIKNDFIIPEDVLYYMASSIKENVRKLEGALNRLIGVANLKYSNSKGTKISLEFAKESLKPIISQGKKEVTIDRIREFVAQKYNIKVDEMISKSNKREIAVPRQIAMFVCKKLTENPLHEIGKEFGGKHHSTVLHSINKVETSMLSDYEFSKEINSIIKFFAE